MIREFFRNLHTWIWAVELFSNPLVSSGNMYLFTSKYGHNLILDMMSFFNKNSIQLLPVACNSVVWSNQELLRGW